jgi:hypothetical protein
MNDFKKSTTFDKKFQLLLSGKGLRFPKNLVMIRLPLNFRSRIINATYMKVCALFVAMCMIERRKGMGWDEQPTTQGSQLRWPTDLIFFSERIISFWGFLTLF